MGRSLPGAVCISSSAFTKDLENEANHEVRKVVGMAILRSQKGMAATERPCNIERLRGKLWPKQGVNEL